MKSLTHIWGNKEIKAYENGRCVIDIILNDYDIEGACEVLNALGYYQLYRSYWINNRNRYVWQWEFLKNVWFIKISANVRLRELRDLKHGLLFFLFFLNLKGEHLMFTKKDRATIDYTKKCIDHLNLLYDDNEYFKNSFKKGLIDITK